MPSTSMVHVRIDDELKESGNAVLEAIGLTASDAIRLLYRRLVAEQAFPFELKVPNAATREAMAEAEAIIAERRARFATADDLMAELEASRGE